MNELLRELQEAWNDLSTEIAYSTRYELHALYRQTNALACATFTVVKAMTEKIDTLTARIAELEAKQNGN